uniref:Uncharacterized protein n=1 Tax=Glossina pallidipes TaxID=7398 RepID=A0A1B0AIG9_GLOPL
MKAWTNGQTKGNLLNGQLLHIDETLLVDVEKVKYSLMQLPIDNISRKKDVTRTCREVSRVKELNRNIRTNKTRKRIVIPAVPILPPPPPPPTTVPLMAGDVVPIVLILGELLDMVEPFFLWKFSINDVAGLITPLCELSEKSDI